MTWRKRILTLGIPALALFALLPFWAVPASAAPPAPVATWADFGAPVNQDIDGELYTVYALSGEYELTAELTVEPTERIMLIGDETAVIRRGATCARDMISVKVFVADPDRYTLLDDPTAQRGALILDTVTLDGGANWQSGGSPSSPTADGAVNAGLSGASILRSGGALKLTNVTLQNNECNVFDLVNTSARLNGGAIYMNRYGSLSMTGCTVTHNRSENSGGGLSMEGRGIPVSLTDTNFIKNRAKRFGGGVHYYSTLPIYVDGGKISGNVSGNPGEDTFGGGLYVGSTAALACLSGAPVISGNTEITPHGARDSDLYLQKDKKVVLRQALSPGASVGVRSYIKPITFVAQTPTYADVLLIMGDANVDHAESPIYTLQGSYIPDEQDSACFFSNDGGTLTRLDADMPGHAGTSGAVVLTPTAVAVTLSDARVTYGAQPVALTPLFAQQSGHIPVLSTHYTIHYTGGQSYSSFAAPANAGAYNAEFAWTDEGKAIYVAQSLPPSAALDIDQFLLDFSVSNATHVYDSAAKQATLTLADAAPDSAASVYQTQYRQASVPVPAPTDAGTYSLVVTLTSDNYAFAGSSARELTVGFLTIRKASFAQNLVSPWVGTFDGNAHGVSVSPLPSGTVLCYGNSPTTCASTTPPDFSNSGIHPVYYKLENSNFEEYIGLVSVVIEKKPLSLSMVAAIAPVVYTGLPHTPALTVTDAANITASDYTVTYQSNVSAGAAGATITATASGNYSGSVSAPFTIQKATITGVAAHAYTGVYDLGEHGISLSGLGSGDIVKYSADGLSYARQAVQFADAGSYTVFVQVDRGSNYEIFSTSATVTIGRAPKAFTGTAVFSKRTTDPSFALDWANVSDQATLLYTVSSGQTVIKVVEGRVVIKSKGSAVVRVTAPATRNYDALSEDISISVTAAPTVRLDAPAFGTGGEITLSGTVVSGDYPYAARLQWRQIKNPAWTVLYSDVNQTGTLNYQAVLAAQEPALIPNTEYAVQLIADDGYGAITVQMLFRTPPATPPTGILMGSVTDNVNDGQLTVTIEAGNTIIASAFLPAGDGNYQFDTLPPGIYNVVLSNGVFRETKSFQVDLSTPSVLNLTLSPRQSAVLIGTVDSPRTAVGGLPDLFSSFSADARGGFTSADNLVLTDGGTINFQFESRYMAAADVSPGDRAKIVAAAPLRFGFEFLDLSLKKLTRLSGALVAEPSEVSRLETTLLKVDIPVFGSIRYPGAAKLFRVHGGGVVETIPYGALNANLYGEYFEYAGGYFTLYLSRFSTYAFGYALPADAMTYSIKGKTGPGGSLDPTQVAVERGKSEIIRVLPNTGYQVADVWVDGVCVGAVNRYVFSNVTSDHVISAVFVLASQRRSARFTDITGHWAYGHICDTTDSIWFPGQSETTFAPNVPMTRAMFLSILARLYGADLSAYTVSPFSDVQIDTVHGKAVAWGAANHLISGTGGAMFDPDRAITRQEACLVLYRFAELTQRFTPELSNLSASPDVRAISPWADTAVRWAVGQGLMEGRGHGVLAPRSDATRAEIATMMANWLRRAGTLD